METLQGVTKIKEVKGHSRITKTKLVKAEYVNVSDIENGTTEKLEILDVISNPANADYNRRGVITKGTIIRTEKGLAKIISRPGQTGVLSAVIYKE